MKETFQNRGWVVFDTDPRVTAWATAARPFAEQAIRDPANAQWLQCEGTWFVGVDALDNDTIGAVPGGPALAGPGIDLWLDLGHAVPPLHRAQVSVTYPGYPKPRHGESDGAFRYRLNRDAAHVDGLLPMGPDRQRHLREPHAFILGIPLNDAGPHAAPLVVWDQSPAIVARHLAPVFAHAAPETWAELDLTAAYHAARQEAFATCERIEVPLKFGQSVLLHHHCLHGVAPWSAHPDTLETSRMIAYFRPEWPRGARDWARVG